MDFLSLVTELFTNADHFLVTLATEYGWLVYAAMFLIFFLETGIVVMAFLPGDSLLFVAGTVAATGTMSPWGLMLAVILGACLGNTLGFHTGRWLGNRIYDGSIHWIDAKKLQKTQVFYEKHGGKTIVLARFVPIVRGSDRPRVPLRQHPDCEEQPFDDSASGRNFRGFRARHCGLGLEVSAYS